MTAYLGHSFLIAMPRLAGGYFADALIYVCTHDAQGAMGLLINRPSRMNARSLAHSQGIVSVPQLLDTAVLEGGPVAPEQGFILHSEERQFDGTLSIAPGIALSSTRDALAATLGLDRPAHALVCLGYAGWGAGQLDAEIEGNVWLTAPASRLILFDAPFEVRRARVAQSLGLDLRMLAIRTGHA